MKIWMKFALGMLVGTVLALVLPVRDAKVREFVSFLFTLSMNVGRYALLPLVFFTIPVAIYERFESGKFWNDAWKTVLLFVASGLSFSILGLAAAVLAGPVRIPLLPGAEAGPIQGIRGILLSVFPENILATPTAGSGGSLLPVAAISIILGLAFCHDRVVTRPAVALFDSFCHIFYQINSFFVEFIGILIIPVTIQAVFSFNSALMLPVYRTLLLTVGIEVAVAGFILVPAFLWLAGGKKNPYPALYGMLAPALASFVSGDVHFSAGTAIKHAKENLGIRRRSNGLVIPLAILAGRAGTVMVTSTCFYIILSSYSDLGIPLSGFIWIIGLTPFTALIAGSAPRTGVMVALMTLCSLYGRGFENGYLIIAPVAFPVIAAGSFLDTLWAGCVNLAIARGESLCSEKEARFFI